MPYFLWYQSSLLNSIQINGGTTKRLVTSAESIPGQPSTVEDIISSAPQESWIHLRG